MAAGQRRPFMRQSCTALWISIVVVLAAVAVTAAPANAQVRAGVRAGVSVDPDQFYVGGHIQTAPVYDRLRFRPNIELGVGSDFTLAAFNFEFVYPFASRQKWHPYVGAGPALNWASSGGNSDLSSGLNFLFGAENTKGLFFEVKLGAFDSPNVKFGVGYTFP